MRILNLDTAAAFIGEQLQYVSPIVIEQVFAASEWRNHLPLEEAPGGEAVREMGFDVTAAAGRAEIFVGNGENLPTVELAAQRILRPVFDIGIKRQMSDIDLEAAALAARQARDLYGQQNYVALDKAKEEAAAASVAAKHDDVAINGIASLGILGITNQSGLPAYVPPLGNSGSALWANKTGEEIVADMNGVLSAAITAASSLRQFWPDYMVISMAEYLVAADPSKKLAYTNETPLAYFQRTNVIGTNLTIAPWNALNGKGDGGTGFALAYRKRPDVISYMSPLVYRVNTPPKRQVAGWEWAHTGRTAGVAVKRPFAVAQMEGF